MKSRKTTIGELRDYYAFMVKEPWCPLFGQLFDPPEDINDRSPITKIIRIIEDARTFWQLNDPEMDGIDDATLMDAFESSWPLPSEVDPYPSYYVRIARGMNDLYRNGTLHQHALSDYKVSPAGYDLSDQKDLSTIDQKVVLDNVRRFFQPQYMESERHGEWMNEADECKAFVQEELPDVLIWAILAIAAAYDAMEEFILYGAHIHSPHVYDNLHLAQAFLCNANAAAADAIEHDAYNLASEADKLDSALTEAKSQLAMLETNQQYARAKSISGGSLGGKRSVESRKSNKKPLIDLCGFLAQELKKTNKHLTNSSASGIIESKLYQRSSVKTCGSNRAEIEIDGRYFTIPDPKTIGRYIVSVFPKRSGAK